MLKKVCQIVISGLLLSVLYSCGGPASYTTPIVNSSDIVQSDCIDFEGTELPAEGFEAKVSGSDVIVTHSNIPAPKNTVMGIIDVDGIYTYDGKFNYYYLEGGEEFITLSEKFRYSSSETTCLYSLKVKITNVSGGIYDLMLFDDKGRLSFSKEVRVR
ncbi:MAG TPA: hypothetical protein PKG52_09170 [bacterium]|nr:hypothetical protein [bacterium]HPS29174.1 hypothetical protein [bacterium]